LAIILKTTKLKIENLPEGTFFTFTAHPDSLHYPLPPLCLIWIDCAVTLPSGFVVPPIITIAPVVRSFAEAGDGLMTCVELE